MSELDEFADYVNNNLLALENNEICFYSDHDFIEKHRDFTRKVLLLIDEYKEHKTK